MTLCKSKGWNGNCWNHHGQCCNQGGGCVTSGGCCYNNCNDQCQHSGRGCSGNSMKQCWSGCYGNSHPFYCGSSCGGCHGGGCGGCHGGGYGGCHGSNCHNGYRCWPYYCNPCEGYGCCYY